jgi:hypothetical protein
MSDYNVTRIDLAFNEEVPEIEMPGLLRARQSSVLRHEDTILVILVVYIFNDGEVRRVFPRVPSRLKFEVQASDDVM